MEKFLKKPFTFLKKTHLDDRQLHKLVKKAVSYVDVPKHLEVTDYPTPGFRLTPMDFESLKPIIRNITTTRIHPFDLAKEFLETIKMLNNVTVPKNRKFTYLMENDKFNHIIENIRTQIKKFKKFKIFEIDEKQIKFLSNPETDDRKL